MIYYLFDFLHKTFNLPGTGVFQFLTFRALVALIVSLGISLLLGEKIIHYIRKKSIGETVRDLGLAGQIQKTGTPTMGGLIILLCIIVPTLLFAKLNNIYVLILLITTLGMGLIGFVDDYIKVFKKDKEGLKGKVKVAGQVVIGFIVALLLYYHPDIKVRNFKEVYVYEVKEGKYLPKPISHHEANGIYLEKGFYDKTNEQYHSHDTKSLSTTIPFMKSHEMNYGEILSFMGDGYEKYGVVMFVLAVIFIVTAVSNGANMTDGIDGLAAGTSAIIGVTLGIFAYVSGNTVFANYLNIMYIPNSGELIVFISSFVGACVGFLWYNSYPAQVFMGDTGSLTLGGIIAVIAICIRKELLLPILCGIFFVENLSVILQVGYFKYTKKRFGLGKRIFLMSPLHHHYQKLGLHESKIVSRFWIIGVSLAFLTIITLKIR